MRKLSHCGLIAAALALGWLGQSRADSIRSSAIQIQNAGSFVGATTILNAGTNMSVSLSKGVATFSSTASGSGNPTITVANAASTGTTTSTLTKLTGAPSTAVISATTDTGGVVGITTAGAGTTGNATITIAGQVNCVFDGATTAGHYVQISTMTAGNCTDTGAATYPTSGQVIGRVLSTNASGGTYQLDLFPAEIKGATGATANQNIRAIGAGFDGGGSALTTGGVTYFTVPFACTIAAWNITVDTGTISFDVWKIATGTAIPTVSNSILSGGFLSIGSGTAVHSTTLTDFTTTTVSANDIFGIEIEAVSSATKSSLVIQCNAT